MKSKSDIVQFVTDEKNDIQFYYLSKNKIVFRNNKKNIQKTFQGMTNNKLITFCLLVDHESIIFLFEKGQMFIIPTVYIEGILYIYNNPGESFDTQWEKIISTDQKYLTVLEGFQKSSFTSQLGLTDLLICNRRKEDTGKLFKFDNKLSQIIYKNILTSFFPDKYDVLHNNTTITYWIDQSNTFKYVEHTVEYLIINVDCTFLFLNLTLLECATLIKFNNVFVNKIIHVNYKEKYQYLLMETENDYYSLTLIDKDNDLNIINQDKDQIIPVKLKFCNKYKLSIQVYNGEDVIVSINDSIIEIYYLFELTKAIFSLDLSYVLGNGRYIILNVFLFEKLLFILIKDDKKYRVSMINLLRYNFKSQELTGDNNTIIWCNQNYNMLESPVLYEYEETINIGQRIISSSYCYENRNTYSLDNNVIKKYKERSIYKKKGDRPIFNILTNTQLLSLNYNGSMLNCENITNRLQSITKDYYTLRKVELLNYSLNGRIFECLDDVLNKLETVDYERSVIFRLLWSNKKNIKSIIDYSINGKSVILIHLEHNSANDIITRIAEYIEFNLFDKTTVNNDNLISLCLLYLLRKMQIKEDYKKINSFINIFKKEIYNKSFEKNMLSTNKQTKLNISLDRFSISSLEKLDVSKDELPFDLFNKSMSLRNLNTSLMKNNTLLADNVLQLNNTTTFDLFLKIFVSLLYSLNTLKNCLPQINKSSIYWDCDETNNKIIKLNNIDNIVMQKIKKWIYISKDKIGHMKILLVCLIVDSINISEKIIEEILFMKYKKFTLGDMTEIMLFLNNVLGNLDLTNNNKITINIEGLVDINFIIDTIINKNTEKKKDDHVINSFIYNKIIPYLKGYNSNSTLANNVKFFHLSIVLQITSLMYLYYLTFDKSNNNLDLINDYVGMINVYSFKLQNKNMTFYLSEIKAMMKQRKDSDIEQDLDHKEMVISKELLLKYKDNKILLLEHLKSCRNASFKNRVFFEQLTKNSKLNIKE